MRYHRPRIGERRLYLGAKPSIIGCGIFLGFKFRNDGIELSHAAKMMPKRLKRKPPARQIDQIWIGFPVTAIAASFSASAWVGWAWQV